MGLRELHKMKWKTVKRRREDVEGRGRQAGRFQMALLQKRTSPSTMERSKAVHPSTMERSKVVHQAHSRASLRNVLLNTQVRQKALHGSPFRVSEVQARTASTWE